MDTSLLRGRTGSRVRPLFRPASRPSPSPHSPPRAVVVAAMLIVGLGVALRFWTASHLWLDEALSVNIARLPLSRLPDALRHDGAPPFYYVLLHYWMRVFGTGDLAVRALSGLFAVASLPLVWLGARRVGGRVSAWAGLLLLAASPFAIRYATEARMYSLLGLLTLAAFLSLRRLLERPSIPIAAGLAVLAGLLVLTHYWSLYLLAVIGVLLMARLAIRRDRGALLGLIALAGGGLFLVPWLPVFAYQAAHTGTPWAAAPPSGVILDTVREWSGGMSGAGQALGFVLVGLAALAVFARPIDAWRVEFDLRTRPGVRGIAVACFGALGVAQVAALLFNSAFVVRYTSVVFPLFILVAGFGAAVLVDDKVRRRVLAFAIALGLIASAANTGGRRTEAGVIARALDRSARPGDLVAYCPDQLGPSVSRLVNGSLVQVTFPALTAPERVDWVDYSERNHAARPSPFARTLVDRAGPHAIWLVWSTGYRTFGHKCSALVGDLGVLRPDMKRIVRLSVKYEERMGLVRYRSR